ncbi:MAG TPA: aldo/keto reductase [Methylomirabilota bacterium]|nr:aldo/keto reductase [Methylomirabilota bacterium]
MSPMIAGHATAEGTAGYVQRFAGRLPAEHFRPLAGAHASSLGLGTYLGREDAATDALYGRAVARALERGVNVLDTAINYRHQRSERAIGVALAAAITGGLVRRDEVIVATKGGYLAFDGEVPPDPRAYFLATYVRPGIIQRGEIVGSHCMAPRYLRDQIDRSRANLGLETIDVYYVHNPESQLDEIGHEDFRARLREAFAALEAAGREGKLRVYGTATWNGYRVDPGEPGALSLPELVEIAREVGGPDHRFRVVQLPYNLAMPEAFTRANQKLDGGFFSTLDVARHLGVYVMASASVLQGRLTQGLPAAFADLVPDLATDAQRAIQFVRSTPGVGTALVGMKSVAHVEENAAVAAVAPLAGEQVKRLFSEA